MDTRREAAHAWYRESLKDSEVFISGRVNLLFSVVSELVSDASTGRSMSVRRVTLQDRGCCRGLLPSPLTIRFKVLSWRRNEQFYLWDEGSLHNSMYLTGIKYETELRVFSCWNRFHLACTSEGRWVVIRLSCPSDLSHLGFFFHHKILLVVAISLEPNLKRESRHYVTALVERRISFSPLWPSVVFLDGICCAWSLLLNSFELIVVAKGNKILRSTRNSWRWGERSNASELSGNLVCLSKWLLPLITSPCSTNLGEYHCALPPDIPLIGRAWRFKALYPIGTSYARWCHVAHGIHRSIAMRSGARHCQNILLYWAQPQSN